MNKARVWILVSFIALALALIAFAVKVSRDMSTDHQVIAALQSTNQVWEITEQGAEILRRLDRRAIPMLLRLSEGRDPRWYKLVNALRKVFKMPALNSTIWARREMARRGFAALRAHGAPAVPALLQRLHAKDPTVRRFSVQMLGAIGPAIGQEAFRQMTNCLSDANRDVRNDVVWALQFHRPEEYPAETLLAVYLQGLQDPFSLLRQNAMIGFKRMGVKAVPARSAIEKALNDSDSGVRSLAQEVLKEFEK
jgi:HEAT repeat protein